MVLVGGAVSYERGTPLGVEVFEVQGLGFQGVGSGEPRRYRVHLAGTPCNPCVLRGFDQYQTNLVSSHSFFFITLKPRVE